MKTIKELESCVSEWAQAKTEALQDVIKLIDDKIEKHKGVCIVCPALEELKSKIKG